MKTNSHQLAYVWTGEGRIVTQSGTRYPINSGHELARPFVADHGWLERRPEIAKHCVPLGEHLEAQKPAPAKEPAELQEAKPAKPKRKPRKKAEPKAEE